MNTRLERDKLISNIIKSNEEGYEKKTQEYEKKVYKQGRKYPKNEGIAKKTQVRDWDETYGSFHAKWSKTSHHHVSNFLKTVALVKC
jgi:hypothetical protein